MSILLNDRSDIEKMMSDVTSWSTIIYATDVLCMFRAPPIPTSVLIIHFS